MSKSKNLKYIVCHVGTVQILYFQKPVSCTQSEETNEQNKHVDGIDSFSHSAWSRFYEHPTSHPEGWNGTEIQLDLNWIANFRLVGWMTITLLAGNFIQQLACFSWFHKEGLVMGKALLLWIMTWPPPRLRIAGMPNTKIWIIFVEWLAPSQN